MTGLKKAYVFDTEANGFLDKADTVWCASLAPMGVEGTLNFGPQAIGEAALPALSSADELVGHNIIQYDLPLLEKIYEWRPPKETNIIDTVIMSRLLRSDRKLPPLCPGNLAPHSLAAWGYRVGRGKPDHDDWSQFSPEMMTRCSEDAAINRLTYETLLREAKANPQIDWTEALEIEHAIAKIIATQEQNGVPLDLPLVWNTRFRIQAEIRAIDKELVPLVPQVPLPKSKQPTWPTKQFKKDGSPTQAALKYYGDSFAEEATYRTDKIVRTAPINLGSDKQVKEYLLSIGWEPTEWNFKKGPDGKPMRDGMGNKIRTSPKLTLDSLESCTFPEQHSEMGDKIVRRLMLAHRSGMLTGWIRDVRPDGRISAQAIPMGTPTGRMTHRQVVNVPGNDSPLGKELRSCFTTVPGYTRVGTDLSSCQLRGLCHYMEDAEYQRQVIEGDPHQYAADLAGLAHRQQGKKLNYTVLFGGGDDKVATDLGMSKQQAKFVRATFFRNLPALANLQNKLKREWKQNGYLVGLDGRAIWVRAEHMLLVYLMQALESVVMKTFIIRVVEQADKAELDYQLVTTMHDECQWLVKDEDVEQFTSIEKEAIDYVNKRFNLTCPQAIDINLGQTWSDCH